jgi:hypothetical protein
MPQVCKGPDDIPVQAYKASHNLYTIYYDHNIKPVQLRQASKLVLHWHCSSQRLYGMANHVFASLPSSLPNMAAVMLCCPIFCTLEACRILLCLHEMTHHT